MTAVPISRTAKAMVWIIRILLGLTFIVSGWAKSVDPWSTIYKVEDYLNCWEVVVPREMVISLSFILAVFEFTLGIILLLGVMRRVAVWMAGALMASMLPLSVYIYLENPVDDCGCFGDLITISNSATLVKNVFIAALALCLVRFNTRVCGVVSLGKQWFVVFTTVLYSLSLLFIGYRYQPTFDFRSFPVGSDLANNPTESVTSPHSTYIYEKDGEAKAFSLDQLPDSSWTFVSTDENTMLPHGSTLEIYREDENVTDSVLLAPGKKLCLIVADPGTHYVTRARLVNGIASYLGPKGISMFALIPIEGYDLEAWKQLVRPKFEVFTADDTLLKEIARGDASLVALSGSKVLKKINLASVPADILSAAPQKTASYFEALFKPHEPSHLNLASAAYISLLVLCIIPLKRKKTLSKANIMAKAEK